MIIFKLVESGEPLPSSRDLFTRGRALRCRTSAVPCV
ncbi:Uncharacterised protein [Vibrio cholerae]|nr:Uncharacterised protein [Vibrio cholerae]